MRYYHGGKGGMRVGMMLLPPSITGAKTVNTKACNPAKVYVTTSKEAALIFAALHPSMKGCVYEVAPVGPVTQDPDTKEEELAFECDRASIVKVHRLIPSVRKDILKTVLRQVRDHEEA